MPVVNNQDEEGPVGAPYEWPQSLKPENPVEDGKSIVRIIGPEGRSYVETATYAEDTDCYQDKRLLDFTQTELMEEALPYDDLELAIQDSQTVEASLEEFVAEVLFSADGFLVLVDG